MRTSPRWRGVLASAASAAVLVAVPLVGAQTASAQQKCAAYPATVCLTVSPVTVRAGDRLRFTASGFASRQRVTAVLASHEVVLGRFTADMYGRVSGTVTIPYRTTPGHHTFKLIAHDPDRELTARIKVLRSVGEPGDHKPGGGPYHHGSGGGTDDHGSGGEPGYNGSDCASRGHHACDLENGSGGGSPHRSPALANTGSDKNMAMAGAAGALLVTVGGGTLAAARRRRHSS